MQARAQSLSWRLAGWEDATFPVPSDFTANCPLPRYRTRERVVHHTYTVNIFCPALRVTVGVHKRHTLWRALLSLSLSMRRQVRGALSRGRAHTRWRCERWPPRIVRWRQSVQRLVPFLR